MAEILAFPSMPSKRPVLSRNPASDPASAAQILFFTGVRYERHAETIREDAGPTASPTAGGGSGLPPQKRRRRG